MKKVLTLCIALLMVGALTIPAFAAVPCMRSGCFNGFVNVYCGGKSRTEYVTHTNYHPFWPFGASECTYKLNTHSSYGICNNCGYYYDSGAGLVADHASDFGHKEDCPKYGVSESQLHCNSGDLLDWYL